MIMNKTKIPAGAREKLPFWFSSVWSLRAASVATCTLLFGYVTFYCTDVLKLAPEIVGIVLLISKVFDGFTDLVVGFLIDKTNTRLGKARPYELSIIFLWIFSIMMYSTPMGLGSTGKIIWVFIMYTLVNSVCITILYGNDVAYLNRAVLKQENKVKVTAVNGIYTLIISVVLGIIIPQVVAASGVDPKGWRRLAFVIAVPMIAIGILRFIFIKEIKVDSEKVSLNLKEGFSIISKNKYIWIFAVMYFCYHLANNVMGTAQTYYFQYELEDIGFASFVSMGMIIVPFILAAVPKIMQKIGTLYTLRGGLILMASSLFIRMLFGTNRITLVLFSILFLIGTVPVAFMSTVYVFECIDYGAWKTGKRVEALISGVLSFFAKVASAFASAGIGFVMGLAGYDGTLAVQSASSMAAIQMMYNIAPILITVIAIVASFAYDVEKKLPQIRQELAETENGTNQTDADPAE